MLYDYTGQECPWCDICIDEGNYYCVKSLISWYTLLLIALSPLRMQFKCTSCVFIYNHVLWFRLLLLVSHTAIDRFNCRICRFKVRFIPW